MTETPRLLTQWAPWPDALEQLVAELDYNPAWRFRLYEHYDRDYAPDDPRREHPIAGGTTLEVIITHRNSYPPHDERRTGFTFPVPPCTFDRPNWALWLFDRISEIERHERMEHFRFRHEDPARVAEYERCLAAGLSDSEARGTAWPEDAEPTDIIERPVSPLHGPGNDPNRVHIWLPDLLDRRRVSFRGVTKVEQCSATMRHGMSPAPVVRCTDREGHDGPHRTDGAWDPTMQSWRGE